jgi:hypothetical protein
VIALKISFLAFLIALNKTMSNSDKEKLHQLANLYYFFAAVDLRNESCRPLYEKRHDKIDLINDIPFCF